MLRILHLSDFHLNKSTRKDWNLYLKEALFTKLDDINEVKSIDFIAFTGDMLDKGGIKDFEGASNGFEVFKNDIIQPLLDKTGLSKEYFFIVPGNHDIEREKDSLREELGNRDYFKLQKNISEFIAKESINFSGMKRIQSYKTFESNFYNNYKYQSHFTNFGSSFIVNINGEEVGIACLNSAWRCFDNKDDGRLIIGQDELAEHTKFISKTKTKIALVHHPLDSLSSVEKKIITSHISKDFDLLLFGHSHSTETSITSGFSGSIFYNMAPSGLNNIYSNDRDYSNGFTIIDICEREICAEYWRYNQEFKEFVLNTDAGKNGEGRFCESFPNKSDTKIENQVKGLIENIIEVHYGEMNDLVIGVRADVDSVTCVKDAFIVPPIDDGESLTEENRKEGLSITQIVKSTWNQIFFGGNESGKTILLYRLVVEYVDSFDYVGKVPVYINIDDLGNKSFITAIKEYLSCKTDIVDILLKTNKIILLIDNLDYKKYNIRVEQLKRFQKLMEDYPKLKIIAASDDGYLGSAPIEFMNYCKVPFKSFFIKNLRVREIKKLMRQWVPQNDAVKEEETLDKMINDFKSYSLPSTAMSVSLFLWSTEHSNTKPINQAVLLEMYIEIILQKLSVENIYRDTFDFKNKTQMLAAIAKEMLVVDEDNYSLKYSDYAKVIEIYLDNVGFDFDSSVIAKYFIDRKIFHKYQNNRIKFSYSCFFHFFLAKRMIYEPSFYKHVTDESQYYKFGQEIDYYTGLTRSNKKLLTTIYNRFLKEFSNTDFILNEMNGKWDKHFILTPKAPRDEYVSKARDTSLNEIKENRPSDALLEDFHNRRLSGIKNPHEILKKKSNLSLEGLLVIVSNVLRNSEGVEDKKLKSQVYNSIIKYSMTWMVLYREFIIEYVIINKKLPSNIPMEVSLKNILNNLPLHMQMGLSQHLGTFKLSPIILEKIKLDLKKESITKSDIESFLSIAIYSDIQGRDFPKYFKKFIKGLKNNPVRDYAFYKLIQYYYKRTKEGSPNEEMYLDMLAELRIRSQKLPNRLKESVIKSFKDSKKKFTNNYFN